MESASDSENTERTIIDGVGFAPGVEGLALGSHVLELGRRHLVLRQHYINYDLLII